MSFEKNYPNRKDWRKPYIRRGRNDAGCRPHGGCTYCYGSRMYAYTKKLESANEQLKEYMGGKHVVTA